MTTPAQLTPRLHPLMATMLVSIAPFAAAALLAMTGLLPMRTAHAADQPALSPPVEAVSPASTFGQPAAAPCYQCGVIDNVREVAEDSGIGMGAVVGGVLGGLLGNQVGKGRGNTAATILGAAGGAYAGHQYQKSGNRPVQYEISVRMMDGTMRNVRQETMPGWRIGERVRFDNGQLVRQQDDLPPR